MKNEKSFFILHYFPFHLKVLIKCFMSASKNSLTTDKESEFGAASKYKAPRIKWVDVSEI